MSLRNTVVDRPKPVMTKSWNVQPDSHFLLVLYTRVVCECYATVGIGVSGSFLLLRQFVCEQLRSSRGKPPSRITSVLVHVLRDYSHRIEMLGRSTRTKLFAKSRFGVIYGAPHTEKLKQYATTPTVALLDEFGLTCVRSSRKSLQPKRCCYGSGASSFS